MHELSLKFSTKVNASTKTVIGDNLSTTIDAIVKESREMLIDRLAVVPVILILADRSCPIAYSINY